MENFVLYEDIGHGNNCLVYKGRRKGTINFVAINCIEKCKRHLITNSVRLTHEISHNNIVKFYEWYETSNHLWMITELCTGGSLQSVIEQDHHLPETCIRQFGIDMVNGLQHIHSLGIIYCDLKPSNILIDGPGILKYADFGLSRMEGEDIDELFQQFAEAGEQWSAAEQSIKNAESLLPAEIKNNGSPMYMAPELLQGEEPAIASDLWSLGCVLYEMFTGHPPFLAENYDQLKEKVLNQVFTLTKARGSHAVLKPSSEFQSLLNGLLTKNPERRIDWSDLVVHTFWQGCLKHHAVEIASTANQEVRESLRRSVVNFTNSLVADNHLSDLLVAAGEHSFINDGKPDSMSASMRPRSALGNADTQVQFTLSSRPHTAMADEDPSADRHLMPLSQNTVAADIVREQTLSSAADVADDDIISTLVYHSTDFTVTPIIGDAKKPSLMKYEPKLLAIPTYTIEKLSSMAIKDQKQHCAEVVEYLRSSESGQSSTKQVNLLGYCGTIAAVDKVADVLVQCDVLTVLAVRAKESQQVDLRSSFCHTIALIAASVRDLSQSTNLNKPLAVLKELLHDGFSNVKLKIASLSAVGEMINLIAFNEELLGTGAVENWTVPPALYSLITRCLRDEEDAQVKHVAVKIIENVATKSGRHVLKFATVDVGFVLWRLVENSENEQLRTSAALGLCLLCRYTPAIFQGIVEKVGLPRILSAMSMPASKVQQAVVTMIAGSLSSKNRRCPFVHDREFLLHIMRLLESPVVVIRAKAFLVLHYVVAASHEMLCRACENRLIMYVERDNRKQKPSKTDTPDVAQYMTKCLDQLMICMVNALPAILAEVLSCLEALPARKRSSAVQVKHVKECLPLMAIVRHFVTSAVLRPRIICESFMNKLSLCISHLLTLDSGLAGSDDFIHNVFTVVESVVQHPAIVTEYCALVVDKFLPTLATLIFSSSGDSCAMSLRLFSEISCIILNNEVSEILPNQSHVKKFLHIVSETVLPKYEEILLQQDPMPSYALRLLLCLLEQHPVFIRNIETLGLVPVLFQVLEDHKTNPVNSVVKQIIGILSCFIGRKETNAKELYEQGIVRYLCFFFMEASQVCLHGDSGLPDLKSFTALLMIVLDTINGALKYLSEVVRRALEARKEGHGDGPTITRETEEAEELLLANKPLAKLISPLTQLMLNEDTDIADLSVKCLSLLVQLYGADSSNNLSAVNLECYSTMLKRADAKKQKIVLRILKRMITMDRHYANIVKQHGSSLIEALRGIVSAARVSADVTMSTLAAEILRLLD